MAARACANFGVRDLLVVHAAKLEAAMGRARRSAEKARQLGIDGTTEATSDGSCHCALDLSAWKGCERLATNEGEEVLQSAKLYGNLKSALAHTGLSVAFSGRQGRNFREPTLTLKMLAQKLASKQTCVVSASASAAPDEDPQGHSKQAALVFGSEDVGLSTESVLMCTDVCRLQTANCPSLNLSHAVAVVLARIFEEVQEEPVAASSSSGQVADSANKVKYTDDAILPAAPPVWTAEWSELCRARLEAQGYPTKAELWHGRGRRKCLYAYRLFRVVTECARSLQRANATDVEVKAWTSLVQSLSQAERSHVMGRFGFAYSTRISLERDFCGATGGVVATRVSSRWVSFLDACVRFASTLSASACEANAISIRKDCTGDTGSEVSASAPLDQSCGTGALASSPRSKEAMSIDAEAKLSKQAEALQAMQADMKQQQALLDRRGTRLREVLGELQSKDLQILALRHQIRIKDALLGCLQDEGRLRFETLDSELESLLEKALTPLTAILTREQMAHAAAGKERTMPCGNALQT
ncbi:trmJ [Symbiodinium pilosum]|uniref:TrmJ protein n=1 Tax=Symbiodinium pilosum TaxID=2952 RepID=A0A812XN16_SYMPI|nr:trmJ [Symbiodinium pilosum]